MPISGCEVNFGMKQNSGFRWSRSPGPLQEEGRTALPQPRATWKPGDAADKGTSLSSGFQKRSMKVI